MDHFLFNVHAQSIGTESFCQENLTKVLMLIPRKVKKVLFQKQFLIKKTCIAYPQKTDVSQKSVPRGQGNSQWYLPKRVAMETVLQWRSEGGNA